MGSLNRIEGKEYGKEHGEEGMIQKEWSPKEWKFVKNEKKLIV